MIRRLLSYMFVTIIVLSQLVNVVEAKGFDENFFSNNSILFYDPTCPSETSDGIMTLTGKNNLENILQFFMKKGLTLAQAAGIAGNFEVESGLDPTIIQGGSHATAGSNFKPSAGVGFGLAQWTSGGRQQGLVQETASLGVDITNLNGQLAYAWKELSENYPQTLSALKATDDPVQAAVAVHDGYESSADSHEKVVSVRGGNAKKFYDAYVDAPALAGSTNGSQGAPDTSGTTQPSPSPSPDVVGSMSNNLPTDGSSTTTGGSCTAGGFSGGDLGKTTLAYAWPQYAVRTDQEPAYADAVRKAASLGEYTGGNGGNDCGGFVTRLMINSGFEKRYNSNGHGGATTAQEAWLKQNWTRISDSDVRDASKRQPGDVAVNSEHTYVYVGQIPGFGSKIASASLGGPERSPMAGHESATDTSFDWYRKSVALTEAPK
ncbi:MAG: exported protein of unknown function [Candidatus Saccharibacteria bacterium]|nr:exported protein of unknown function [Candidatus Saccharibacteria bacterium]